MNEKYFYYTKAIEALGEKIAKLETDLFLKDYEIEELKNKLADAERAGAENDKD